MTKKVTGETICAVFQKFSGSEKLYGYERVDIKIFRRVFFVSQCLKVPVRESLSVLLVSGIEKLWIRGVGEHQGFP